MLTLKSFRKITLLLTAGLLASCTTSPTGRMQLIALPDNQVNQMGLQAFNSLKQRKLISRNRRYNQIAQCVAYAITREVGGGNWEVVVFEDSSPNAFALPGEKIGVHTGMFNVINNSAQLAAVIGHEVGHVLARHSNERSSEDMLVKQGMGMIQQSSWGQSPAVMGMLGLGAQYGVLMPFSRTQESEADSIGLNLMAKAGFDPQQSVTLWQLMSQAEQGQQPVEFMSTHPSNETRVQNLAQQMPQAMTVYQQAQAQGKHPNCG
jgi:predicted Zn-dependent protease